MKIAIIKWKCQQQIIKEIDRIESWNGVKIFTIDFNGNNWIRSVCVSSSPSRLPQENHHQSHGKGVIGKIIDK